MDAHILNLLGEVVAEDPVAIAQQVARCCVPRKGVTESFDSPSSRELLEDLRWFMEDFLGDATATGPVRAAATKTRMLEEGDRRMMKKCEWP